MNTSTIIAILMLLLAIGISAFLYFGDDDEGFDRPAKRRFRGRRRDDSWTHLPDKEGKDDNELTQPEVRLLRAPVFDDRD